MKYRELVQSANTGLDAIKRAPIVEENTGVRCLRIGDISQLKDFEEWGFTKVEDINFEKFQLKKGDIIIARTGATIGVNKLITEDLPAVFNNGLVRIKIKPEYDYNFAYYVLQSKSFKEYINSIAYATSAQPNMQINDLLDFEIDDIDINSQKKIGKFLAKIDKNIINREKEIKLTKKIISDIYYSMFVQKKDNIEEKAKLGEIIDIKNGKAFKGTDFVDFGVPVIKIKNVKPNKIVLKDLSYIPSELAELNQNYRIAFNDIIITMTGNRINGTPDSWVGKVALFNVRGEYLLNQRLSIIIPKNDNYRLYLVCYLSSWDMQKYFIQNSTSSGGQANISPELLKNIDVNLPNESSLNDFNKCIKPMFDIISKNIEIIDRLELLKEQLIPKLLKGEINLNNIEV